MMVAFDHEIMTSAFIRWVDLRPRGDINDFEKVWILDIPDSNKTSALQWRVRGFNAKWGLKVDEMRNAIRKLEDYKLERMLKLVSDFIVEPVNNGDGCRLCGYPGPLMVVEDPPLCLYCLLRLVKKDEFVRDEVARTLKITPLIS